VDLGLENGKKLRVDTTVVESDIHHPTDSTLLWTAFESLPAWSETWTSSFHKACRDLPIGVGAPGADAGNPAHDAETAATTADSEISGTHPDHGAGVRNAREVLRKTERISSIDLMTEIAIKAIRKQIDHYCGLGDRVLDQARRRVLNGEQVPNEENLFHLRNPHRFDQARQNPEAGGVWPQGLHCGERPGFDHSISCA